MFNDGVPIRFGITSVYAYDPGDWYDIELVFLPISAFDKVASPVVQAG